MTNYIAVDIGGTQLRAACFPTECLTPTEVSRISTRDPNSTPLERLAYLIASIWPQEARVAAIGVAAPGPLDPFKGVMIEAPNIPGWVDLPLKQFLEDRFHVPVALGNDANLAALGEWKYGAAKGHHHVIYITVSTGIGGGVIVGDRLLLGENGFAGELGHITITQDGPVCSCGQRGHLEALASGPALARWAEMEITKGIPSSLTSGRSLTAREVGDAAIKGDPLAIQALARSGYFIGQALANYLHIFNSTALIIGGGVSRTGSLLMGPLKASLEKHVLSPDYLKGLLLTTASLRDEAGLVGALALAQELP